MQDESTQKKLDLYPNLEAEKITFPPKPDGHTDISSYRVANNK